MRRLKIRRSTIGKEFPDLKDLEAVDLFETDATETCDAATQTEEGPSLVSNESIFSKVKEANKQPRITEERAAILSEVDSLRRELAELRANLSLVYSELGRNFV